MRPVDCEACHRPQPKDWRAGQRCIHCGGAVRAETRCAACTHWTPAAKFCRQCAAELVPDEWYGAARMLVAAGVDGLSLAGRVRALEPGQREVFSSRFAVQRALVEAFVQEARFAESFLLTTGHADALEESLLAQLPWGRGTLAQLDGAARRQLDGPGDLEPLLGSPMPETRSLAALALARRGATTRPVLDAVRAHLRANDPLGVEALVAGARLHLVHGSELVTRWNVEEARALLDLAKRRLDDGAERALAEAALLRLTRRDGEQSPAFDALRPRLREGLAAKDLELRAACAMLLRDADALDALLDEPRLRDAALRALSSLGGPHLVRRLRAASDGESRLELLRGLREPLDTAGFEAVTSVVTSSSDDLQREALRVLLRTKWSDVEPAARAGLEAWVARQGLPLERALELLHWAVATGDSARPYRAPGEVQPYAVAAARALALAPRSRETLRAQHLDDFFAVAHDGRPLEVVVDWLGDEATRDEALRRSFHLMGYLASHSRPHDDRGLVHFFAAWERLGDAGRARLAGPCDELFRREVGNPTKDRFLRAAWERFLATPGERAALWRATRSARRELDELRDGDARATALDGGDPAKRFALYGGFDPLGAPELLRQLCERHGTDAALTGLTPTVLALSDTLLEQGEHRHALWLAASWLSEVVNRFRDDDARETWRATALGLEAAWRHVEAKRAATTPKDAGDSLRTFEDQAATELRLAREVVEREAAAREAEQTRAAEAAAREAERQRALAARAAEQAQREADARQQLETARQAVSQHRAAVADAGEGHPLDTEVLLPDQPIATLRDYATLLRAMRGGADVLALFSEYGLTPATWGSCATAWGTVMTKRLDVALRFAKLLG